MIDNDGQPKAFKRYVGLSLEDVRFHTTLVTFYRKFVEVHDEIILVRQSDMTKEEKTERIKQLREELKDAK